VRRRRPATSVADRQPILPTRGTIALLAALAAIGALSTNIILPSFPAIAASLGASSAQLGLTLSVFFIVFAVGQLIVGPLSDRYGRRTLVIGGLLTFFAGGVLCALAQDVGTLILGRAIQAMGVCAASVLARAIARDLFNGDTLARVMAMVIVAMAAAPGFSPLLGSVTESLIGWRMTFLAVSVLGLALAVWYVSRLPETHHASRRAPLSVVPVVKAYGRLLIDARFFRPVLVLTCITVALYGFFAAAPAVLIGALGLNALEMGLLFAATVPVVFAAGLLVPVLSRRWGAPRMTQVGVMLALTGGLLVWMVSLHVPTSLAAFTGALCVFLLGMGIANPISTAQALAPFAAQAGAASALLGFMQMSGAALGATVVTKLNGDSTMASLGLLIVASQALALVGLVFRRAQHVKG
jgi:DHA1 family bicyclomycin/chloramphenicol resistance-like MFS transporter